MRLKDKVAVVTGAAQGIGLACGEELAREGARVMLSDINRERGEASAAALRAQGHDVRFMHCDVGDKAQVDALIAGTVAAFGRVDCAVPNAGVVHVSDFLALEEADFDRVLRVNLKGVFLTAQAAARQMVAQGSGGTIVNMSSINAELANPTVVSYAVSKGGVQMLTRVMALALIDKGIRVNAVGPGSIETEVFQQIASDPQKVRGLLARTPIGRVGQPGEVAKVVAFLASDDSSYIVGQTIFPDGGRLILNYTVPVKD